MSFATARAFQSTAKSLTPPTSSVRRLSSKPTRMPRKTPIEQTSDAPSTLPAKPVSSSTSVKPFKHQEKSLKHAETTPVVFDCSDPGTGKTFVAIKVAERGIKRKRVRKVLVIAPKSLLRSVWYNDLKKFAPGLKAVVSTAGKHEDMFAKDADIYITNTDAVKWLASKPKHFFKDFDMLIVDESSAYKHGTSQRSKAVARIAGYFEFKRLMTATPNSNTITDVWHQIKILDNGKRLGNSFFAFRNAVCTPTQVGRSDKAIRWEDKEGAEEAVFGMLTDIVIRHRFEDCVDIPPNHEYSVPYQMTSIQRKAYEDMRDTMIIAYYGSVEAQALHRLKGTQPKAEHITAVHAASMTTKLLQIASGAVYSSPENYHVIDTARYELVLDMIEARKHSLTFFLWKHQRDLLVAEAQRRKIAFAVIDGTTKDTERDIIVQRYQAGQYQTIFAHPKSAAHGLTLTRGTATIWASPTYDAEIYTQGSKRQHRIGQTQKTETIVVTAEDSVELDVYETLTGKKARMSNLLDLFSTL